jgi:hypothetical protein
MRREFSWGVPSAYPVAPDYTQSRLILIGEFGKIIGRKSGLLKFPQRDVKITRQTRRCRRLLPASSSGCGHEIRSPAHSFRLILRGWRLA